MICDTWSDDPVYDQKKRKNSALGIKTRAQAAHDPYQWPKQRLVLSTRVGQL